MLDFELTSKEYVLHIPFVYETETMKKIVRSFSEDAFYDGAKYGYNEAKEEAEEIINELLINGYDESTRRKALDFLYPDKEN